MYINLIYLFIFIYMKYLYASYYMNEETLIPKNFYY